MIAKNLKSRSFAGCVDYVMRINHDHNIYTSDTWRIIGSQGVIGESREQIIASMEAVASLNPRVRSPAGHISVSFHAADKNKLTDEMMIRIANDYLKGMGLDKTQYIIVRHLETGSPHFHIVYNMIDENGKRITSGHNYRRNIAVCKSLKMKYGLTFGKKSQHQSTENLHGKELAKAEIRMAVSDALSASRSWNDLIRNLAVKNISVEFKHRRNSDVIEGLSFRMNDYRFKASDISRDYSYGRLNARFERLWSNQSEYVHRQAPTRRDTPSSSIVDALGSAAEATVNIGAGLLSDLFQLGPSVDAEEMAFKNEMDREEEKRRRRRGKSIRR